MAKHVTPQMEKINKKAFKNGKRKNSSLTKEAWRRLCRNKTAILGLVIIGLFLVIGIFANLIIPYDYAAQDYTAVSQPPSAQHLFGTDAFGRDLFSRCIYGTRYSLPISLLSVAASLVIGGLLGFVAGYCGGKVDNVIMRFMDIFQAIPGTLLCIAIVAVMGNSLPVLVIAMCIGSLPGCAKTCRGAIMTVRTNDYVESSVSIGASNARILISHMIPNAVGPIIIYLVQMVGRNILMISMLSYIGVGIAPPTPEWGSLLSYGKDYIQSGPYMVIFPGLMIMISVFAVNLFGDGLRDALDPRLK